MTNTISDPDGRDERRARRGDPAPARRRPLQPTWTLIEKPDRTPAETDEMIHRAHASRWHWARVGEPVNLARGEWLCSRVYAMLGRGEPALWHARRCVEINEAIGADEGRETWDLAGAYEAMARASFAGGDTASGALWKAKARRGSGGDRQRRRPDADRAGPRDAARAEPGRRRRLRSRPSRGTPTTGRGLTNRPVPVTRQAAGRRPRSEAHPPCRLSRSGSTSGARPSSWADFLAAAKRVDELGYDALWTWDHLHAIVGDPQQAIFEGYVDPRCVGRWRPSA